MGQRQQSNKFYAASEDISCTNHVSSESPFSQAGSSSQLANGRRTIRTTQRHSPGRRTKAEVDKSPEYLRVKFDERAKLASAAMNRRTTQAEECRGGMGGGQDSKGTPNKVDSGAVTSGSGGAGAGQ
ncbi:hypothetical protein PM082_016011 [Marasmius tenuissimus]|nr:hypothetical protein PM082_016011 [Marasmius tenuissimus]